MFENIKMEIFIERTLLNHWEWFYEYVMCINRFDIFIHLLLHFIFSQTEKKQMVIFQPCPLTLINAINNPDNYNLIQNDSLLFNVFSQMHYPFSHEDIPFCYWYRIDFYPNKSNSHKFPHTNSSLTYPQTHVTQH